MNEFNKPYEYFEEKGPGGILLILFFMLISVEPILGIISAFVLKDAIKGSNALLTGFICASVVFILFSFITGITLKKLRRYAVTLTKVFLAYRLLFMAPVVYISMRMQIEAIPYRKDYVEYVVSNRGIITSFLISIAYVLIFSIGWYVYLVNSKKVRELFPKKEKDFQAIE